MAALTTSLAEAIRALEAERERFLSRDRDFTAANESIHQLMGRINSYEELSKQNEEDIAEKIGEIGALNESINALQSNLDRATQSLAEAQSNYACAAAEVDESEQLLTSLRFELQGQHRKNESLQGCLNDSASDKTRLQELLQKQMQEACALKESVDQLTGKNMFLDSSLSESREQVERANAQIAELAAAQHRLTESLSEAQQKHCAALEALAHERGLKMDLMGRLSESTQELQTCAESLQSLRVSSEEAVPIPY